MKVLHIYREKRNTGFSIEGIFQAVKKQLRDKIDIEDYYYDIKLPRLKNILKIGKHARDINHITGDVNFLLLGLIGKKNILTIHDFGYYENPVHSKKVKIIYRLLWYYFPLKFASRVTVVSEFTKSKLLQYFNYPQDRISVIGDPVKPAFKRAPRSNNDIPRILMIGSGNHKNLAGLIEATKGKKYHLDIVGWPGEKETAMLAEYNTSYTLYNSLTDEQVMERYQACDVLFFASFYEGFGMPVIEVQTVGRPVVTSNYGAMLEIGRTSCILVNPNDSSEIGNAIDSLLSDTALYNATVEKGYDNAAKFDNEKIAQAYGKVYEELYHSKNG